jgi:hypothetical protein
MEFISTNCLFGLPTIKNICPNYRFHLLTHIFFKVSLLLSYDYMQYMAKITNSHKMYA